MTLCTVVSAHNKCATTVMTSTNDTVPGCERRDGGLELGREWARVLMAEEKELVLSLCTHICHARTKCACCG